MCGTSTGRENNTKEIVHVTQNHKNYRFEGDEINDVPCGGHIGGLKPMGNLGTVAL